MDIEAKRMLRTRFMQWLYETTDGNIGKLVLSSRFTAAVPDVTVSRESLKSTVKYLEARGLVRTRGSLADSTQDVRITFDGVVEIETALRQPDEATANLASVHVTLNVQSFGGSNYGSALNASPPHDFSR